MQISESTTSARPDRGVRILRALTAGFFVVAGANHFLNPEWYLQNQMPGWVPFPDETLVTTGIAEIAGGVGLLLEKVRRWAGYGLVALLIGVFPGNIHMAAETLAASGWGGETIGVMLRLPLQAVFIIVVLRVASAPQQEQSFPLTDTARSGRS